jgi:hypothetical protein
MSDILNNVNPESLKVRADRKQKIADIQHQLSKTDAEAITKHFNYYYNAAKSEAINKDLSYDDILRKLADMTLANHYNQSAFLVITSAWEDIAIAVNALSDKIENEESIKLKTLINEGNHWALNLQNALSDHKSALAKHNGKKGSTKRHAPMAELKAWTLKRYSEGKWPSANKAAFDLKESVITHGKTINVHLTEGNAQRTIAEWINEHKKHTT